MLQSHGVGRMFMPDVWINLNTILTIVYRAAIRLENSEKSGNLEIVTENGTSWGNVLCYCVYCHATK